MLLGGLLYGLENRRLGSCAATGGDLRPVWWCEDDCEAGAKTTLARELCWLFGESARLDGWTASAGQNGQLGVLVFTDSGG